jgi:hypothetical protein
VPIPPLRPVPSDQLRSPRLRPRRPLLRQGFRRHLRPWRRQLRHRLPRTQREGHAVISRSNGSGRPDTSATAAKSSGTKQSAAAPPVGNQPLSLAPDGHGHSAAASRSREPAATGIAAEAS